MMFSQNQAKPAKNSGKHSDMTQERLYQRYILGIKRKRQRKKSGDNSDNSLENLFQYKHKLRYQGNGHSPENL